MKYIYEYIDRWNELTIFKNIILKRPVFIIEPFHAYHHKKNIRFFPTPLPSRIEKLLSAGKIDLIRAKDLNSHNIYFDSAEKAVAVIENVYPTYRKQFEKLLSFISNSLKTESAENAFKIVLCNNIAEFYSTNTLLHRVEELLGKTPICFSPSMNLKQYLFIRELLNESGQDFHQNKNVSFSAESYLAGSANYFFQNISLVLKLCAQSVTSALLQKKSDNTFGNKKFTYGVSIIGTRQLRNNQRSPDFMLGSMRRESKVVFFPLLPLAKNHEEKLRECAGEVCPVPRPGRIFSNPREWSKLLIFGIRDHLMKIPDELCTATLLLYNYYAWQEILKKYSVKNFISHADFGVPQIGRNAALSQAGTQTWYFTDSINHACYFQKSGNKGRHPFWTYLNYDHFVTWTSALANYYKSHPGSFRNAHVVGCLWSEHIRERSQARQKSSLFANFHLKDTFIIACFDTTYTRNGFTNYSEGLDFADHLLRLVDNDPKISLILKEKKDRAIHFSLDPVIGPKLMELYNRMNAHPRIHFCSNQADASEVISVSDMVISFPFTSTTFEALCSNRPAIWHDAAGNYRESIFANIPGLVTHDYEELKSRVDEIMVKSKKGEPCSDIPDSPYMDPFHDGKAIDRFRDLLSAS